MNAKSKIMAMVMVALVSANSATYAYVNIGDRIYWWPVLLAAILIGGTWMFLRAVYCIGFFFEALDKWQLLRALCIGVPAMLFGARVIYIDAFYNPLNIVEGSAIIGAALISFWLLSLAWVQLKKLQAQNASAVEVHEATAA